MTITFNDVPAATLAPFSWIEFDSSRAQQGPGVQPYEALLMGQKLAAGPVAELVPTVFTNAEDVGGAFAFGSQIHAIAKAWFANNAGTKATFVAIDEASGATNAIGTFDFTGTATEGGTVALYLHGRRVAIPVASGMTSTAMQTATIAAINGFADLMLTAASGTGQAVTLTARGKGALGDEIDLRVSYLEGEKVPAGLTVDVVAMAAATPTNPDITEIFAVLGDTFYNVAVCPWKDSANLAAVETEFEARFGPAQKRGAVLFLGTMGFVPTRLALGAGRNSKHTSIIGFSDSPSAPFEWAAAVAGQVARSGAMDPARPFTTLPLVGILAPVATLRDTLVERELLLADGISTYTVATGGAVQIDLLVTNYQTGPSGASDTAYQLVRSRLTLEYLRWSLGLRFATRYPRHKLAGDNARFGAGQKIMTPRLARAELLALFRQWESLGLVEGFDQFKADLIVEINASNPSRLDMQIAPNLVNGFTVAGVQIQFIL